MNRGVRDIYSHEKSVAIFPRDLKRLGFVKTGSTTVRECEVVVGIRTGDRSKVTGPEKR